MNLELTKEECGYLIDAVVGQIEMLENNGNPNDHVFHMSAYTTLLDKLEALAIKG